ncbi:MAG TPA: hypothetical protein VFV37_04575 [Luteibaculaceae bacterium]|nr:hypothetical protein [Luteibaculaceae bacterium]
MKTAIEGHLRSVSFRKIIANQFRWLYAILVCGILFAAASCQKDPMSPVPPNSTNDTFFTVRFRAIVDTNGIKGFITEREAFFPHLNDYHIHTASFLPQYGNVQPDVYAPHTLMNGLMYRGVRIRWGVYVIRLDSNGYEYDRTYWLLPADTIDSRDDTLYTFRWPEDTLRAVKHDWMTRRPV